MNDSEKLFESFCNQKGIHFSRVLEECNRRSADYLIQISNKEIVIEVKQLENNRDELNLLQSRTLENDGDMFTVSTASKRIRKAIESSSQQLKNTSKGTIPTLVIVCDTTIGLMGLDSEDFLQAMFGDEIFNLSDYSQKFGGNRKMTQKSNASISAVGWLRKEKDHSAELFLIHNPFSKNPIDGEISKILSNNSYYIDLRLQPNYSWKLL
jgi:peroxiredoxin family protein